MQQRARDLFNCKPSRPVPDILIQCKEALLQGVIDVASEPRADAVKYMRDALTEWPWLEVQNGFSTGWADATPASVTGKGCVGVAGELVANGEDDAADQPCTSLQQFMAFTRTRSGGSDSDSGSGCD